MRDFSLDSMEELAKILEVTENAADLNLYVRLSMPNDKAVYSLAGKFGVRVEDAEPLLTAARDASARLGVCFHVGSQCMNPDAYQTADPVDLRAAGSNRRAHRRHRHRRRLPVHLSGHDASVAHPLYAHHKEGAQKPAAA